MSKSTQTRTSAQTFDGGLPCVISTPRMTFATSAKSAEASFVAPCDMDIVSVVGRSFTTPTSAAAALNLLTATGGTRISYPLQNVAGVWDATLATQWAANGKRVNRGDAIVVALPAATAVGVIGVTIIGMPV